MKAGMSMIVWFLLTVVIHQNGCGLSAQNLPATYSVPLSPYGNSGFQSRLIPIFNLNGLFNKNQTPTNSNSAAIAGLQRELNSLTARVAALETSVNKIKARIATANNTINCTGTGFKLVLNKCYRYFPAVKTHADSLIACTAVGAVLAIPEISITNDAFGIRIKRAFPAANLFWIGVYYTAAYNILDPSTNTMITVNSIAFDLNGNQIANQKFPNLSNGRWNPNPPGNVPTDLSATTAASPPHGVFVTIPPASPGKWTITPGATLTTTRAYLCQKRTP